MAGSARRLPVVPLLLAGLVASMVVALALGSEPLRLGGVWETVGARLSGATGPDPVYDAIVWDLRAPRVVMAAVVGAGLALAGAVMQTLVRNPLADPYLLGVSAGAGVGATLVIVVGVFGVSVAQGGLTPLRLVLTGVVLSAAFSSVARLRQGEGGRLGDRVGRDDRYRSPCGDRKYVHDDSPGPGQQW
nr:iron chelate uptake ABC transporter family permease subunit [Actinophytocola oryzae]